MRSELASLGLEPGYLLFVGNPKPHKNLEGLLAAFADLDSASARLVIVGEKSSNKGSTGDARPPSAISIGRVDDARLPALYQGALALCFPSLYEGFGLPVVEAMASGTPVIASSTPAVAEIAGDAALLVDPRDASEWTAAMAQLLVDPTLRQKLAARGQERAREFTWGKTARRTLELYRAVLAERPV